MEMRIGTSVFAAGLTIAGGGLVSSILDTPEVREVTHIDIPVNTPEWLIFGGLGQAAVGFIIVGHAIHGKREDN